jgi:hypothetical protein
MNKDELLKKILLNMKYDSRKTLNENTNLIGNLLNEQLSPTTKVGDYTVSFQTEYNRIKIDSPSGREYYWSPSGGWYRITYDLGNETFTDLDPTKDSKTITTLRYVLKKSGIGSLYYIKNTEQGNKFREWVNKKDPTFAKSINLSLKGPYDNDYIRKAWAKYGDEYKVALKPKTSSGSVDSDTQRTIQDLKSKGFDASGAISMNQAYALAALRGTKKLTDQINERIFGAFDSPYFVCVKKVGSTCSPGSYLIADTFNVAMAQKINSREDQKANGLKPPQYTLLTNFYFDWGKIMNDLTNAFKYDKNAYRSELFPDGWWNWFTAYWGTDNLNQITLSKDPKLIKVPGGGHGYPSAGLTTSDVHTFLTVVELGSLILGFLPTPLSPIFMGISSVAGLADAGTYYYEGDKYMGSMMLALEIIPGGELLKFFKGTKTAYKLGKEGSLELLEKGSKGTLNGEEKIVYQNLVTDLKSIDKKIIKGAEKQIGKEVVENLTQSFIKSTKGYSPKEKLRLLYNIMAIAYKKIGSLPKMVINVGGTMVGIDQLYLALFGRDEDRQKSVFREIYYLIQGKGLPEDEEINRKVNEVENFIKNNGGADEFASDFLEVANSTTIEEMDKILSDLYANKPQEVKSKDEQPQDQESLFSSDDSKNLEIGNNGGEITLKTKTPKEALSDIELSQLENNKDEYDFYIWSIRLKKWNNVDFNSFKTAKKNGYQVNYSQKLKK